MAPLIALIGGCVMLRTAGLLGIDALDGWQPALRGGLALMFALTATAHFSAKRRDSLIAMVPPRLPRAPQLVTITGILEVAGAAGLALSATAPVAAICLALLLLAMFPANVSAARRQLEIADRPVTPLVPRTLLQVLFVAACLAAAL